MASEFHRLFRVAARPVSGFRSDRNLPPPLPLGPAAFESQIPGRRHCWPDRLRETSARRIIREVSARRLNLDTGVAPSQDAKSDGGPPRGMNFTDRFRFASNGPR